MEYFKKPFVPLGDGQCSDFESPCPEVRMPRGTSYLYITPDMVAFRRKYPRVEDANAEILRVLAILACLVFFAAASRVSAADTCPAITHYRYHLPTSHYFPCGQHAAVNLFDVEIPSFGRALARAAFVVANSSGTHYYYWGSWIDVGSPIVNDIVGEDLCPVSNSGEEHTLGYGELSASTNRVRVKVYQGGDNCEEQVLVNWTGAYLDVWVENPKPECQGQDIVVASHNKDRGAAAPYRWKEMFRDYLIATTETTAEKPYLAIMGVAVGDVLQAPWPTCTSPMPSQNTLAGRLLLDGESYWPEVRGYIPPSWGMGHLLLRSGTATAFPLLGRHKVTLQVREEIDTGCSIVTTGGYPDWGGGGGAVLAVLRAPNLEYFP